MQKELLVILSLFILLVSCAPQGDLPQSPPPPGGAQSMAGKAFGGIPITNIQTLAPWGVALWNDVDVTPTSAGFGQQVLVTATRPSGSNPYYIWGKVYMLTKNNQWTAVDVEPTSNQVSGSTWVRVSAQFKIPVITANFNAGPNYFLIYVCKSSSTASPYVWDCGAGSGNSGKWQVARFDVSSTSGPCDSDGTCETGETDTNCAVDCDKAVGQSCQQSTDCDSNSCVSGTCQAVSASCGNNVAEGTEQCDGTDSSACTSGQTCSSSCQCTSSSCTSNAGCTGGKICENGACVIPDCLDDTDCSSGNICAIGRCVPQKAWILQKATASAPACTAAGICSSAKENEMCVVGTTARMCKNYLGSWNWHPVAQVAVDCPTGVTNNSACTAQTNSICWENPSGMAFNTFKCIDRGTTTQPAQITITDCMGNTVTDPDAVKEVSCGSTSGGLVQAQCGGQTGSQTGSGPTVPSTRWVAHGICGSGSVTCPTATCAVNDLGNYCSNKGDECRISNSQGQVFVTAKCGDVSSSATYEWTDHAECMATCTGSSCLECLGQVCQPGVLPGSSCGSGKQNEPCYVNTGSAVRAMFCKPVTGVTFTGMFALPQSVGNNYATGAAVSMSDVSDVVNSKATHTALVIVASLGILVITLLNFVHKEED